MGIELFKRGLLKFFEPTHRTDLRRKGGPNLLPGQSLENLRKFERKTWVNEAIHLVGGTSAMVLICLASPSVTLPYLVLAGLAAVNYACVLLQRYNRERLYGVIRRKELQEARTRV
jgi:hypothetical protein